MEKWVNHPHIYINEKNLQNLGLKINIYLTIPNDLLIISKRVFDVKFV